MTKQLGLTFYPETPGYKESSTSKDAALDVKDRANTLRNQCLGVLRNKACTADEIADILGESILSIRPRISELHQKNLIIDTSLRRKNASGKFAIVWRGKQ